MILVLNLFRCARETAKEKKKKEASLIYSQQLWQFYFKEGRNQINIDCLCLSEEIVTLPPAIKNTPWLSQQEHLSNLSVFFTFTKRLSVAEAVVSTRLKSVSLTFISGLCALCRSVHANA